MIRLRGSRLLRPVGFDELGLRRAISDRMLPFLVAAMGFLAALALSGWVGAAALASSWARSPRRRRRRCRSVAAAERGRIPRARS